MKVAIIGLGHQAMEDHIPAVLSSRDVKLIGVVENDKKKLAIFKKQYPGIPGFMSLKGLLRRRQLDFVIIAVPHCYHYETTKEALENKIHVLKEKPFAISLKEAKELNRIAEKNNVIISITLQRRFNPIYSTFFQLVEKIGTPFFLDIKYTICVNNPHVGWRGKKEAAGGGCLIDMGYHMVDLLMWYYGLPDKVFMEMSASAIEGEEYDAEDSTQVLFRYINKNIWGSMLISRVIPPKQEFFNIYGTRGHVHIERGKIERHDSKGKLCEALQRESSWPSAAQDQLEYFIKVIQGKRKNISSPEQHFNHLAFIETAYRSHNKNCYLEVAKT